MIRLFVGPLFWTSGEVCLGFQSQGGSLTWHNFCRKLHENEKEWKWGISSPGRSANDYLRELRQRNCHSTCVCVGGGVLTYYLP